MIRLGKKQKQVVIIADNNSNKETANSPYVFLRASFMFIKIFKFWKRDLGKYLSEKIGKVKIYSSLRRPKEIYIKWISDAKFNRVLPDIMTIISQLYALDNGINFFWENINDEQIGKIKKMEILEKIESITDLKFRK